MMKTTEKLKAFAICAAIALALLPATMKAQNDTFFRSSFGDNIDNRDIDITFGLMNDPFGEAPSPYGFGPSQGDPLPLGSGLLIMLTAGAGYAIARSKRSLKKTSALLMACLMTLTFTQCGKKLQTITTNGETVSITLNVGNSGRHIIEPGPGYVPITYEAGDVMYVSNGGSYAGKLTCSDDNGPFVGDIVVNNPADDLYFYFLGGLETKDLESGTTSLTVDISDQGSKLPVLSMGRAEYVEGQTTFTCNLTNKCALVEFDFAEGTNKKVKISNMLCEAKIDFTNNSITPTEKLDAISLYSFNNTEKWGILLLSDVERKSMGMVYNRTMNYSYTGADVEIDIYDYYDGVTVPALSDNNNFLYGNNAITVDNSDNNKNNRVFVVSANGNAVRFAPGNLMYRKSTGEWSFMEHQYDVVETTSVEVGEDYALQDVVDHFGWGCTGFQDSQYGISQNYYMPYSTNHTNSNAYYGPTGSHGLSVMNKSDWGAVANDANLGGHDDWRLLTKDECDYLLKYRLNAFGKRASAQIYKPNIDPYYQNGMMFFPEDWINDGTINTYVTAWNNNRFDDFTALATFLESNGAIYLPAAGYHEVTSGKMKVKSINSGGYYWLSTYYSDVAACCWYISGSSGIDVKFKARSLGYSVRLAR
jgi:hypothetical protein